jgi:hypothetical protein
VARGEEAIEEGALDRVPVALLHRLHESGRAQAAELVAVARVVQQQRGVVHQARGDELPAHAAVLVLGLPHLVGLVVVDEGALHPLVADVARVGAADDAREVGAQAGELGREVDAHHAHARAQEPVDDLGKVGQLVDQQDVDLGALVLEAVLLLVAVAEVDAGAVELEADLALDDLDEAGLDPRSEERAEALGALDVVLREVFGDAAEEVDLQAGEGPGPQDGEAAQRVGLPTAGRATVKDLGRGGVTQFKLLPVQLEAEIDSRSVRQCGRLAPSLHPVLRSNFARSMPMRWHPRKSLTGLFHTQRCGHDGERRNLVVVRELALQLGGDQLGGQLVELAGLSLAHLPSACGFFGSFWSCLNVSSKTLFTVTVTLFPAHVCPGSAFSPLS